MHTLSRLALNNYRIVNWARAYERVRCQSLMSIRHVSWLRLKVVSLVASGLFGVLITSAIVINTITLSLDHYDISQ